MLVVVCEWVDRCVGWCVAWQVAPPPPPAQPTTNISLLGYARQRRNVLWWLSVGESSKCEKKPTATPREKTTTLCKKKQLQHQQVQKQLYKTTRKYKGSHNKCNKDDQPLQTPIATRKQLHTTTTTTPKLRTNIKMGGGATN